MTLVPAMPAIMMSLQVRGDAAVAVLKADLSDLSTIEATVDSMFEVRGHGPG